MKAKRILCLILATLMIVAMLPTAALSTAAAGKTGVQSTAASDAAISSNICTIWYNQNGTETAYGTYNTLDAAVEALSALYATPLASNIADGADEGDDNSAELYAAAGSPVIKLNGNFTGAAVKPNWIMDNNCKNYDANNVVTIVVDGAKNETENYTITCGAITLFDGMAYYNLTIKNTNMIFNRGSSTADNNFQWYGRTVLAGESTVIFDNCNIDQNSTLTNSDSGGLFKLNGFKKSTLNSETNLYEDTAPGDIFNLYLKDTTVTCATAIGVQVHWGADANIYLENSYFGLDGTAGKSNNNDTLIKFYECGDIYFHMDGTSKIESARSTGSLTAALLRDMSTADEPVVYEFEAGAQLVMNNTAALTKTQYIVNDGAKSKIIDKGAIYTASANDVKNGVTLPKIYDESGKARAWQVGQTVVVDNPYKNASATGITTFTYDRVYASDVCIIVDANENVIEGYGDLASAFAAVKDDEKILLYKDITLSSQLGVNEYDPNHVRSITIEGVVKADGSNPKVTGSKGFAVGMGLYNFTVKNLDIAADVNAPFMWDPRNQSGSKWFDDHVGSKTVIENCNVTSAGSFIFKMKGASTATSVANIEERYYLDVKDSYLECTAADNFMLNNSAATSVLNFQNTDIVHNGGGNNTHVFCLNTASTVTFYFDKDCTISQYGKGTATGSGFFHNGGELRGTTVVYLADGVQVNWDGLETKTNNYFSSRDVVINNYGATYNVSPTIMKNGIKLPYNFHEGTVYDYTDGTNTFAADNNTVYTIADATDTTVITPAANVNASVGANTVLNIDKRTFYTSVATATSAAASNDTIVIIGDVTEPAITYSKSKNLAIVGAASSDGSKHTITNTNTAYSWELTGGASYITKLINVEVVQKKGFWIAQGAFLVEDCTLTTTDSLITRLDGAHMHDVDFVNTTWTSTSVEPFMLANCDNGSGDMDLRFTMLNSHINCMNKWNNGNNYGNSSIFYFRSIGKFKFHMDGTSTLIMNSETTATHNYSGLFYIDAQKKNADTSLNLLLEEGAKIGFTDLPSTKTNVYFINYTGYPYVPTYIVDRGANWVFGNVSGSTSNATIHLPVTTDDDGNVNYWTVGGATVAPTYTNNGYVKEKVFKAAACDDIASNPNYNTYVETSDGYKHYMESPQAAVDIINGLYTKVTTADITDEALWTAAGSPTIYLTKDVTLSSPLDPSWYNSSYNAARVRTVVIKSGKTDGTNALITTAFNDGAIKHNAYYNLTLENIDMDCQKGFAIFWAGYHGGKNAGKSTTNLINCNITATGTSANKGNEGLVFKVTGNMRTLDNLTTAEEIAAQKAYWTENFIINFKGTTVVTKPEAGATDENGVNAVFLFHHGAAGEVNIDANSSIFHDMNRSAVGGDAMFMLGTSRRVVINVEDGAELSAKVTKTYNSTNGYLGYALFRLENSNIYPAGEGIAKNTINIADGAKISIDAAAAYTKPVLVINNVTTTTNGGTILNLGDIDLNITAEAANNGFALCYGNPLKSDTGVVLGCYVNGGTDLYGQFVSAGAINEAVTDIEMIYFNENDFDMVYGASLRMKRNENGLRYSTVVSDKLWGIVGEIAEFGTLIAPGDGLEDDPLTNKKTIKVMLSDKVGKVQKDSAYGDNVYHAAVIMPNTVEFEKAYTLSLIARSYMTFDYADGTSATFYTALGEDNIRSMYQVANNLVNSDESYKENEVINNIITVVTDYNSYLAPDAIVSQIDEDAIWLDSSTTCKEVILTGITDKNTVLDKFTENNFKAISVDVIEGANFETIVLKRSTNMITVYYYASTGEMRIMWEKSYANNTTVLDKTAATGTGSGQIVQIGTEREIEEILDNGNVNYLEEDNPLNGMTYIVKLGDGRAMIIDGGSNTVCAENIFSALKELGIKTNAEGKYQIAAWLFTHAHGDHTGGFSEFAKLYSTNVDVEYVIYNFPVDSRIATKEAANNNFDAFIDTYFPNAERVNPHAGLKYYIDNATIEMIYTPELLYSYDGVLDYYNNTSLIFKLTVGDVSALFMGDAGEKAATVVWNSYESTVFACDILQISHHGLYTGTDDSTTADVNEAYVWDNIKNIYTATGATIGFLPLNTRHTGIKESNGEVDTRNGRYTVLVQWGIENEFQVSFVLNPSDKNYLVWGSTVESDEFSTLEKDGKYGKIGITATSVYGYNGKNMINNGAGLTTYMGSDYDSPWVTVINCSGGNASVTYNNEFDTWIA